MKITKSKLKKIIESAVKEEIKDLQEAEDLQEFNAVGGGAVVGYTLPLGMDTSSGHKKLKKKK